MSATDGKAIPSMTADRLSKNFNVTKQLEQYAHRLRLRLEHLDLSDPEMGPRLAIARKKMTQILIQKKVRPYQADRAVVQTLDIAADHQLDVLRRDQDFRDISRSQKDVRRLIKQLNHLGLAISKFPPSAKGKLNTIIVEQDWQNFDTEKFTTLIHAIADTLAKLSPACLANKARLAINEPARGAKYFPADQVARTAPPIILGLWETIPPGTRTQTEADLRNWTPPSRGAAIAFLNSLSVLLAKSQLKQKAGRRPPIERRFGQRVARIWHSLGLQVGRAYNGEHGRHVESSFQRFVRLALTAVGDDSRLSSRQMVNLKSRF
jgi:hypothetical protein